MTHQPGLFDERPEPQPKLEPAALVVPPALRELAPSAWAPNANHLDPNPAAVYLASLLPGSSRYTMTRALAQIAAELAGHDVDPVTFPWRAVRYVHASWLRSRLIADDYAPATANKLLVALRRVLREAFRLGQLPADEYQRLSTLEPIAGSSEPVGRALSAGELRALVERCAVDPHRGRRDAAMVALMYQGGLRRSELVSLDLADYDATTGTVSVFKGKGRKARLVYVDGGAAQALAAWIAQRGDAPGALFVDLRGNAPNLDKRLRPNAVRLIVERRARDAGLDHASPHDFRRSALSDMLDAGVDIATVQRYAGHSSPVTTSRYDRRGERTKRDAASRLHFPSLGNKR